MAKRRTILRIAGGAGAVLVVLAVAGWLAFVPFAKDSLFTSYNHKI